MDSKDKLIIKLHEELIEKEQKINDLKEFIENCKKIDEEKNRYIEIVEQGINNADEALYTLKDRIQNTKEYIRLNFCNRKDINDCWHSGMQDILDLLNGKEIEGD